MAEAPKKKNSVLIANVDRILMQQMMCAMRCNFKPRNPQLLLSPEDQIKRAPLVFLVETIKIKSRLPTPSKIYRLQVLYLPSRHEHDKRLIVELFVVVNRF